MKKLYPFLFLLIAELLSSSLIAANFGWTQRENFGGIGRHRSIAFSIGSKGYMGTGHYNAQGDVQFKDIWEYDPASNSWTQKADFGGGKRYHAVAFSIGNKGYVATGRDTTFANKNDVWEYNPLTNIWMQKGNFLGTARRGAVAFVIGNFAYLGTGLEGGGAYTNTFYRYNPINDTWSPVASMPTGGRISAVGFAIGDKGYVGTGYVNGVGSTNDFWEYNPALNTWTQKANVGGFANRMEASGFAINGKGYLGTGDNYSSGTNYGDFWEYNPNTNIWTQVADFGGLPRRYLTCLTIGNKGYAGTGTNGTNFADFWEYSELLSSEEIINSMNEVKVYPLPAFTETTFDMGNISDLYKYNFSLSIYSLNGSLVQKIDNISDRKVAINRNNAVSGIYFYVLRSDRYNVSKSGKLIWE